MPKKLIITLVIFILFGVATFGVSAFASPDSVALPSVITESTPCPVAACTQPDGGCHTSADPPVVDGSFSMTCPKIESCSDTSCHAWDRLTNRYNRPSDVSLNLWILAPVIFTLGLVLLVRRMR